MYSDEPTGWDCFQRGSDLARKKPRIKVPYLYMQVAHVIKQRATCVRRQVGAVIFDAEGHILSTGYNGTASGRPHCIDKPCPGADLPSGEGLDMCEAIHAEANALLQLKDQEKATAICVTTHPCPHCLKLLSNTNIRTIYYELDYPLATESGRMFPGKIIQLQIKQDQ